MALPAILGGVAGVVFSDFIGNKIMPAQGYGGPLATVAWGYALQAYGKSRAMTDAGAAIIGVGAGMAFGVWRAKNMQSATLPGPAVRPTLQTAGAGYLGNPIQFEDRMDPYFRKVSNIGLP